jgi:putative transposase
MTVAPSIDPARLLEEQLAQASPDLLRELLTTFINTLMSAETDAVCGAAYGQASPDRTNRRNGYRARDFDTRAGTLDLAVPKLRTGSYYPEWLLERRSGPSGHSPRWWRPATCSGSAHAGWTSWCSP